MKKYLRILSLALCVVMILVSAMTVVNAAASQGTMNKEFSTPESLVPVMNEYMNEFLRRLLEGYNSEESIKKLLGDMTLKYYETQGNVIWYDNADMSVEMCFSYSDWISGNIPAQTFTLSVSEQYPGAMRQAIVSSMIVAISNYVEVDVEEVKNCMKDAAYDDQKEISYYHLFDSYYLMSLYMTDPYKQTGSYQYMVSQLPSN